MLAIGFCWCYLTGEWQHDRKKAIKIKNHKISDLFRHLQVGQTECRKRRIWVGRVKLYICALIVTGKQIGRAHV